MVGTSIEFPNAASAKFTYNSKITLFPSLFSASCGISSIRISKSPAIPPCGAEFPLPVMDSCMPSATPAGIGTVSTSSLCSKPELSTPGGLLSTILPEPLQVAQVEAETICPSMVFTTFFTCPAPLQVWQVLKVTPSAATSLFTLIFFSTPLAIS